MGATEKLDFNSYFIVIDLNENSHIWRTAAELHSIGIHGHLRPVWPKPGLFV